MSREIEFQAWNKRRGKMMEWYGVLNSFADRINDPNFVLRQYTGLRDRNGVKIFEGDVLRDYETMATVIWNPSECAFCLSFSDELQGMAPDVSGWATVVGNIYANPELKQAKGAQGTTE